MQLTTLLHTRYSSSHRLLPALVTGYRQNHVSSSGIRSIPPPPGQKSKHNNPPAASLFLLKRTEILKRSRKDLVATSNTLLSLLVTQKQVNPDGGHESASHKPLANCLPADLSQTSSVPPHYEQGLRHPRCPLTTQYRPLPGRR